MRMDKSKQQDYGAIICTLILIALGGVFYYDTTTMVDADSFVFPRAIIFLMLILALLRLVLDLFRPMPEPRNALNQNNIRSLLLVLVMGISISLIPVIGFYSSLMIAFFSIMYLSMYEKWTKSRRWFYPVAAAIAVTSLYLLFERVFEVQFPVGSLFEG
ncbi:MAG: tripartite tricarboxylate transporter TctB family protein [Candidatus Thiodiazotropha sp.]